jgi:hypothetical protein
MVRPFRSAEKAWRGFKALKYFYKNVHLKIVIEKLSPLSITEQKGSKSRRKEWGYFG